MNILQKIFPPKKVYIPLDEDTIKRDDKIKELVKEVNTLKEQIAKESAKKKQDSEKIDEKKLENDFNKKLNEQKLDLEAKKYGKKIKLSKFYKHLFKDDKFKERLEITDKNDEVVLGKFGDFVILEGGKLGIEDSEGNLMSYGRSLNQVLYKPDAFENMAKRGRFTIPMDKDGNWIEDIEYKEIPEPLDSEFDEETGKIKHINWSKVKTSEVKKVIARILEEKNYALNEK